jgi:hypothetical protein
MERRERPPSAPEAPSAWPRRKSTGSSSSRSTARVERCERISKWRIDSISSPQNSSRAGSSAPNPKMSTMPPRRANCPNLLDQAHLLEPHLQQLLREVGRPDLLPGGELQPQRIHRGGQGSALLQRPGGGDQHSDAAGEDRLQCFHPLPADLNVPLASSYGRVSRCGYRAASSSPRRGDQVVEGRLRFVRRRRHHDPGALRSLPVEVGEEGPWEPPRRPPTGGASRRRRGGRAALRDSRRWSEATRAEWGVALPRTFRENRGSFRPRRVTRTSGAGNPANLCPPAPPDQSCGSGPPLSPQGDRECPREGVGRSPL